MQVGERAADIAFSTMSALLPTLFKEILHQNMWFEAKYFFVEDSFQERPLASSCMFFHRNIKCQVALCARSAQMKEGVKRILIMDWDAHHGQVSQNGHHGYYSHHDHRGNCTSGKGAGTTR